MNKKATMQATRPNSQPEKLLSAGMPQQSPAVHMKKVSSVSKDWYDMKLLEESGLFNGK